MNKEKLNAMLNELLEDTTYIQKIALDCASCYSMEHDFNKGFLKGVDSGTDSIIMVVRRFVKEMKEELSNEE